MASRPRVLLCGAFVLLAFAPTGFAQTITEFPVSAGPFRITTGPDGVLWFTSFSERVGRITTAGVATYFSFPGVGSVVDSGSAIVYGATVDNTTGDPSLQIARSAP
jgi:streptogramin lyase